MNTLLIEKTDGVLRVTMNRPDKRNAFDGEMLTELKDVFSNIEDDVRAVVLTGAGKAFCAGADLAWMAQQAQGGDDANTRGAAGLGDLFRVIDEAPRAVVARVNGSAMGGALGIIAGCDIVVAVDSVKLGFTEVRLGLVPAVISPFVVRKIGQSAARRYFLTGERFSAETARDIGLVHEVVAAERLDEAVDGLLEQLAGSGPRAMGEAKVLVKQVTSLPRDEANAYAAATIARLRTSPEAAEGLSAFLQKRKAEWP